MTKYRIPPAEFEYCPPTAPLEIIHQDDDILVVSKPAELLCVPGRKAEHADSLELRVKAEIPEARIVHRLDMCTSGLVIMAMNAQAHRNLGLQFERRKTQKTYIAIVWGHIEDDTGTVELPLICDWPNRPLQMVDFESGKAAQTNWEVLERMGNNMTRVALYPITGRTHQLRVHMAEIGHPIVGDEFYAHDQAYAASERLLLHAHKLMVHHPEDGRQILFESECPY
ncbi:MAG: pseudouridine synthase [Alphaproteobacteria bacterium]